MESRVNKTHKNNTCTEAAGPPLFHRKQRNQRKQGVYESKEK